MTPPTTTRIPDAVAKADNLPSVPGVAVEVLRLSKDEDAGIDEFAAVLERDPVLSARLLRLSNSSLFALSRPVATLPQATMVLGLKTVQLMSLSFSLTSSLRQDGETGAFRHAEFWRRSLIAAVASRSFCSLLQVALVDEAFLGGLLSNLGQLVLAQTLPEPYAEVLREAKDWPTAELEQRLLGFDHASVGGALLASWELPSLITDAVEHSARPEQTPEHVEGDARELVWIVRMAALAVRVLRDEDKGTPLAALHELMRERGVVHEVVERFLVDLESAVREAAELLDLDVDDGSDYESIVTEARDQLVRISLGTAASLQSLERRAIHLENENRLLASKASTDKLTGVANRAAFDEALEVEVNARAHGKLPHALGLLLFDVDHFKAFNDTHGHQAGDRVLRIIGSVLRKLTRDTDRPARYGGEEFAVIVPHTNPFALNSFAERLRRTIESVPIAVGDATAHVTVSIGGACLIRASSARDAERLVAAADKELYASKSAGRNRSTVAKRPLSAG